MLIIPIGIMLFILLLTIPSFRIYFRTGMRSALMFGVGLIISAIGMGGFTYWFLILSPKAKELPWQDPFALPFFLLMLVGAITFIVGDTLYYTKESGVWKELADKTTIWERITGRLPILHHEETPPPFFRKRTGLIIGISLMIAGITAAITSILIKISFLRDYFIVSSFTAIISGLLFIIFSIIFLSNGENHLNRKNNKGTQKGSTLNRRLKN
jgi:hypothetical protein